MNIAVFFGGRSCEHDISIITGVQVLNALGDGYRVLPVYMKDGGFYTSDLMSDVGFLKIRTLKKQREYGLSTVRFTQERACCFSKRKRPTSRLYAVTAARAKTACCRDFWNTTACRTRPRGLSRRLSAWISRLQSSCLTGLCSTRCRR